MYKPKASRLGKNYWEVRLPNGFLVFSKGKARVISIAKEEHKKSKIINTGAIPKGVGFFGFVD